MVPFRSEYMRGSVIRCTLMAPRWQTFLSVSLLLFAEPVSTVRYQEKQNLGVVPGAIQTTFWQLFQRGDVEGFMKKLEAGMGNHSATDMVGGMHENSKNDLQALLFSLAFNVFGAGITFCCFLGLRHLLPIMYAQRFDLNAVKRGWSRTFADVPDQQALECAGLDGMMLIEFHALGQRLAVILGAVFISVLTPLHYYYSEHKEDQDLLDKISIQTLVASATKEHQLPQFLFWVHAGAVWLAVLLASQAIMSAHRRFLTLRFYWLERVPMPRATTLLVEHIPPEYRGDEQLKAFFEHLFNENAVQRAYIVRDLERLRRLVALRNVVRARLDCAQAAWAQGGCSQLGRPQIGWLSCVGHGRDAIDEHTEQLKQAETDVENERDRVQDAVARLNPSVCSASGFVTFSSKRWRRLASREQLQADAGTFVMSLAPDPAEVIYTDLAKDPARRTFEGILARACIILIFLIWTPCVIVASGLASPTKMKEYAPTVAGWLSWLGADALIEGVMPAIVLSTFMSLLPTLLMLIIRKLLSPMSQTNAQLQLQKWFFRFQVIFVLLVTTIGKSLYFAIRKILEHPREFLKMLAESLPKVSHFYSLYLVLGWFAVTTELLRIGPLIKYLQLRLTFDSDEAKRLAEPEDQDHYGIGSRMSKSALMMTVMLVFCTCSPEISVFGLMYFSIAGPCYRYLVVYAEAPKSDAGGIFWVLGLQQIYVGLLLFVLLMVGILLRHSKDDPRPPILAACALFLLYASYTHFEDYRWENLPFDAVVGTDDDKDADAHTTKSSGEYTQPEMQQGQWKINDEGDGIEAA
jgi:hypothetical protein